MTAVSIGERIGWIAVWTGERIIMIGGPIAGRIGEAGGRHTEACEKEAP
jgi:hypothetical protein